MGAGTFNAISNIWVLYMFRPGQLEPIIFVENLAAADGRWMQAGDELVDHGQACGAAARVAARLCRRRPAPTSLSSMMRRSSSSTAWPTKHSLRIMVSFL